MNNFWLAFGLTLFAGLATGIGSIIAFTAKRTDYRFLSVATGFSAGVMLYVSFVEILFLGNIELVNAYGPKLGPWVNVFAFFAGMAVIALIDNLVPAAENPHETHAQDEIRPLSDPSAPLPDFDAASARTIQDTETSPHDHGHHHHKLMRMGLFTALAIGIHNFPEGLATFLAAMKNPSIGVAIAIAIALHNIPEGISVSVPIFYATGNRKKAFLFSIVSGLAEPVGALIAYFFLRVFACCADGQMPSQIMGILFAGIAGIMVYISVDELLPTSRAYGKGHDSIYGLIAGMAVMAFSLLLLQS